MAARPNWSRRLPRPVTIPGVMTLKTLADVRKLLGHIPKERRQLSTWQHVETPTECGSRERGRETPQRVAEHGAANRGRAL